VSRRGPRTALSASPLIRGGAVILPASDKDDDKLHGFDLATGETLWECITTTPGYGSAISCKLLGADCVAALVLNDLFVLRKTGASGAGRPERYDLAWRYAFPGGTNGNATTPLAAGPDLLVLTNERQTQAVRLSLDGGKPKATQVWAVDEAGRCSTPVLYQQRVYLHNGGELVCLALDDGKVLSRLPLIAEHCTVMLAGSVLLCLGSDGMLTVADASQPALKELASYPLMDDAKTWSHPAAVEGSLIIRSNADLRRVDLSAEANQQRSRD